MDKRRKRRIRLIVALSCALILAGALAYTSFDTSNEAVSPSKLLATAKEGKAYQLTGKVVKGSIERKGTAINFRVRDRGRDGSTAVALSYRGTVPDPFREGREVIVNVRKQGDSFVGERNSLVTKCPSKFSDKKRPQKVSST